MNGEGASGRRGREIRRKKLDIDQTKLDHVASVLGARSDAIDLVLFREELIDGIRSLAGTGGVENYFDEHPDW